MNLKCILAAGGIGLSAMIGTASASTVNFGNATCITNCQNTTSGTFGGVDFVAALSVGTVYKVESTGFTGNPSFDALVEVIGLSAQIGTGASSFNINGSPANNDWVHLRYSFVDSNMNAVTLAGPTTIRVTDVDSNSGGNTNGNTNNFTEVVGVNKPVDLAATGDRLEEGGFLAGGPSVGSEFDFVRLKQVNNSWQTVGNVKDFPTQADEFAAVFDGGTNLQSFDLIWGVTGARSDNAVRGFEVLIDQSTPPNVVPVPASLPLLVAGLGGLMVLRRRSTRKSA